MPKKEKYLLPTDKKIMEYLENYKKENGITMGEVCAKFGMHQNIIGQIKAGGQSFTIQHFNTILKEEPNLNANWFTGKEINIYRKAEQQDPLTALRQAVKLIEQKLK